MVPDNQRRHDGLNNKWQETNLKVPLVATMVTCRVMISISRMSWHIWIVKYCYGAFVNYKTIAIMRVPTVYAEYII